MKKFFSAMLAVAFFIAAMMLPSSASDEKTAIRLCFIVDNTSINGCADGNSNFDKVLDAAVAASQKVAFFFDDTALTYNDDYAFALMKASTTQMPVGIYENAADDFENAVKEALIYQKYVMKSASRLLLSSSAPSSRYGGEFAVFTVDATVASGNIINAQSLINLGGATIAIKINGETADASAALFASLADSNVYISTPTETGFYANVTEE